MNEIFMWSGVFIVALIVMSKIPGLEHFVKPIIDLLFTGIKFVAENGMNWFIWLIKNLMSSHVELVRHLILSPGAIDPSQEVRSKEKK
jgi:hypothetical protein